MFAQGLDDGLPLDFAEAVFFAGILLTAFGSSFYHLAPDNERLFWDRLDQAAQAGAAAPAGLAATVTSGATRKPKIERSIPGLFFQ